VAVAVRIFQDEGLVVAQDDRFLATSTGRLIAVHHNTLGATEVAASIGNMALFGFSDHDTALVGLRPERPQARPTVVIVGLTGGRTITLGNAAEVAGDPEGLGAFATVAAESQPRGPPPPGGYAGEADGRVELRDFGKPAVLLATSAEIEADVHQSPGPANLGVFPDRQGDKVAVRVNPTATGDRGAAVVVLDRNGRLLGAIPAGSGPIEYSQPAWSPNGTTLVYPSIAVPVASIARPPVATIARRVASIARRAASIARPPVATIARPPVATIARPLSAISVWKLGDSIYTRTAPDLGASFGYCLWAATGTRFLCASTTFGADQAAQWVVGDARRGPLLKFPAAGVTLAWLSSPD
jgi:hypothetical protein